MNDVSMTLCHQFQIRVVLNSVSYMGSYVRKLMTKCKRLNYNFKINFSSGKYSTFTIRLPWFKQEGMNPSSFTLMDTLIG